MVRTMKCPFCGSSDVIEETESFCVSYDTQLVHEGKRRATWDLPYCFCRSCGNHFDVVEIGFYPTTQVIMPEDDN